MVVHFVYKTGYASLFAMELKKDHLLVKKIKPRVKQICPLMEAYQTLQTTNMNFEKLLG